ncbi:MAG: hypothetical protein HN356_10240, partial [Calditrichaeota bacterium]|nr:hypothetical protein [Calditrichota bacterium]
YNVQYQVLSSRDYGTPQSRKRLYIVGIRSDLHTTYSFPPPQKLTTFLLTDHIPTVMNGRVLTFATKEDAQQMSKFPDEVITDFQGYLTLRGRPDKRVMIELHEESIFPEVVSVSKGDIVEWSCISTNSKTDVKFRIQGYEEIGEIVVPTGGEIVRIRMLAERPGSGFPIMRTSDGKVLGMLKVSGAHTKDEESM